MGQIKRYNSIGKTEAMAAMAVTMNGPLSGYLAGHERGGPYVCGLEEEWAKTFGVRHAIATNSATSALMAAAFAVGLERGDRFLVPAMTMSATAAAPMFTGATPVFGDVSEDDFALAIDASKALSEQIKAIFITNLFGHPAELKFWRQLADAKGIPLIEDNAQSPFATEDGRYTGTIGHIGCWSLNYHKHMQCGEGGICTTDDDDLAAKIRAFTNHGEHVGSRIGLNLRMTEVTAAIARVQLGHGPEIVAGRVKQAEAIIAAIGDIPGLRPPAVRDGCTSVYYTIPFLVSGRRHAFCEALLAEGVPIVEGYVQPLNTLPAFSDFGRYCRTAGELHATRLLYVENCAYDFTPEQIEQVGAAFKKAAEMTL